MHNQVDKDQRDELKRSIFINNQQAPIHFGDHKLTDGESQSQIQGINASEINLSEFSQSRESNGGGVSPPPNSDEPFIGDRSQVQELPSDDLEEEPAEPDQEGQNQTHHHDTLKHFIGHLLMAPSFLIDNEQPLEFNYKI